MVNGIYIAAIDKSKSNHIGIYNKINGQVKAFQKLGVNMSCMVYEDNEITLNGQKTGVKFSNRIGYNLHRFLSGNLQKYFLDKDFIYIRYSIGDYEFYKLIKNLSKYDKKIIVEIPTWPYKFEKQRNIKYYIKDVIDILVSKKLHKYVHKIAVTAKVDEVYGVKAIQISNGVNIDNIPIKEMKVKTKNINLVGIANISKWHGYDRVIMGLKEYYKCKNDFEVIFNIIGDGEVKNDLVKLVKENGLEEKVVFHGVKTGNELNNLINIMDIGISSLGLHRIKAGDPIKTKEFIARGLPVIFSYDDAIIGSELMFVYKATNDDAPINIMQVVEFHKTCKMLSEAEIRAFAIKNLTWESQIKKIVEIL